jgi:hypothetical protein
VDFKNLLEENNGTEMSLLSIDKEGNWFYKGLPIIHRKIYLFFNQHLEKDPNGSYCLRIGQEIAPVHVEDTPYVITDILLVPSSQSLESHFIIMLNDETEERLNLETLSVGQKNVLYCEVKGGKFRARFLRKSYYHLASHVHQEGDDRFYIPLNGRKFYITNLTSS